jgi:hypothetical protein
LVVDKRLNVLLILKIQDQKNMNSGNGLSRNRSSSEIAGISPYDGKSVHYSLFTYRQLFVELWSAAARRRFLKRDVSR